MSRYDTPTSVSEAIEDVREAHAALRQIASYGGTTAATSNAIRRHQRVAERAISYLLAAGERYVVGALVEERELARRLALSPGPRPELSTRLNAIRRELRTHL